MNGTLTTSGIAYLIRLVESAIGSSNKRTLISEPASNAGIQSMDGEILDQHVINTAGLTADMVKNMLH